MDKYVTLLGVEQIQNAANQMKEAAESMRSSANIIEESLRVHAITLRDFIASISNDDDWGPNVGGDIK